MSSRTAYVPPHLRKQSSPSTSGSRLSMTSGPRLSVSGSASQPTTSRQSSPAVQPKNRDAPGKVIPITELRNQTQRPSRISVIPFEEKNGKVYFYLALSKAPILTSIGGGVEPEDRDWFATLMREWNEEMGDQVSLDLDALETRNVVISASSWTFFIPLVPGTYPGSSFQPTAEIMMLYRFTQQQFAFLIDPDSKFSGNFEVNFRPGKFLNNLLSVRDLNRVVTPTTHSEEDLYTELIVSPEERQVIVDSNEEYRITIDQAGNELMYAVPAYPADPIDMSEAGFFERLRTDARSFNGRLIAASNPNGSNYYIGWTATRMFTVAKTPQNIKDMNDLATDLKGKPIIYTVDGEGMDGLKTRPIWDWIWGNQPTTSSDERKAVESKLAPYYLQRANTYLEMRRNANPTAEQLQQWEDQAMRRCTDLINFEAEVYETGKREPLTVSTPNIFLQWVLQQNQLREESSMAKLGVDDLDPDWIYRLVASKKRQPGDFDRQFPHMVDLLVKNGFLTK